MAGAPPAAAAILAQAAVARLYGKAASGGRPHRPYYFTQVRLYRDSVRTKFKFSTVCWRACAVGELCFFTV